MSYLLTVQVSLMTSMGSILIGLFVQPSQRHEESLSSANVILSCQVFGEQPVARSEDPR